MIRKANYNDLDTLDMLSLNVINAMHNDGIFQWQLSYPRKRHFQIDIDKDSLFVYEMENRVVGVMALYEENDPPYRTVKWLRNHSMVIHRILVDPTCQTRGVGQALLYHALKTCRDLGYESLKIDTHPSNYKMRHFLKKHQFHELEYIAPMHRIGFERLIEFDRMNRILIFGSSGSGKTTLSKILHQKLNIPYLHLDSIYWVKDWAAVDKEVFNHKVREFIHKNTRFVIDGNYTNFPNFIERIKRSDTIIILDYPLKTNLKGIIYREKKYKHRYRSDMATGCIEEIDQEFLEYVTRFDTKQKRMRAIIDRYLGQKHILRFKTREDLMRWTAQL